MTTAVRAIRGATTVDVDDRDEVVERTTSLLEAILERNEVGLDDIISVLFTATDDIHSVFPAEASRPLLPTDVPVTCARELQIDGALPRCIRVMMHVTSQRSRKEIRHVYLEGAVGLRPDLP